jgi:hypothetical protein
MFLGESNLIVPGGFQLSVEQVFVLVEYIILRMGGFVQCLGHSIIFDNVILFAEA